MTITVGEVWFPDGGVSNMIAKIFPSIWLGDFRSKVEYDENNAGLAAAFSSYDWIDDRLLHSRHPFSYPAYCTACNQVTKIQIAWTFGGGSNTTASIHPAWTETAVCEGCGLNSRMRALLEFLKTRCDLSVVQKAYIAEQITPFYQKLKTILPSLVGSEYLGSEHKSGEMVVRWRNLRRIRHEDLTSLSFANGEFNLAMTLDVFEHIPNYRKAFAELWRVLSPGGRLVFTIPFFYDLETTRIRASVGSEGIIHHLPPEIHGNPASNDGSLCFQNFGWDILLDLRNAGFSDAMASMYWGPWQGHLGFPFFVFSALKT
jgi:SAM-dependent methyltransferase